MNQLCQDNNAGITLDNNSSGALVEGNIVHDNFERAAGDDYRNVGGFPENCSGIKFMHNPSDHVIRNNEVYNQPSCMHLKYHAEGSNNQVYGNRFHDCTTAIYGSNNGYALTGNVIYNAATGVFIGGNGGGYDSSVTFNTCFNVEVALHVRDGDSVITDNIFAASTAPYAVFVYNGFYDQGDGFPERDLSRLQIDRNCYHTTGDVYRYGYDGSGNTFHDLAGVQGTFAQETNSTFGDPLFIDADGSDFMLTESSPCAEMGAFASPMPPRPPRDGGVSDAGADRDGGVAVDGGSFDSGPGVDSGVSIDAGAGDVARAEDAGMVAEPSGGCACGVGATPLRPFGALIAFACLLRLRRRAR